MKSKAKIFLLSCLAFIFGVALASFTPAKLINYELWWFGAAIFLAVNFVLFRQKIGTGGRWLLLLAIFSLLGFWRYTLALPVNSPDKIWHYNNQAVEITGLVSGEPEIKEKSQKLEIETTEVSACSRSANTAPCRSQTKVSGKILITANLYPAYNYGDRLKINCSLKAPEQFNDFAYDRYLARYDIYSLCSYPEIELLVSGQGNLFYQKIFSLKDKFRNILETGLPEPEASLAKAIVLGDKKGLPADLREDFSRAGLSHIVAISGLHITILASLILYFLTALGFARRQTFFFASLFLFFYLLLIGLPPSAMRAGLMGFLVLWALYLGRLNRLTNSLILAAAILLLINPRLLRDDLGFELSFLAVLGIALFQSTIERAIDKFRHPAFKKISLALSLTLAAQILTLPLIAYNFLLISLAALPANLLVLWLLPFLLFFILAALVLSFFFSGPVFVWFLPARLILKYIITTAELIIKLPGAYFDINSLWPPWLALYYLIIIIILFIIKKGWQFDTIPVRLKRLLRDFFAHSKNHHQKEKDEEYWKSYEE